MTRVWSFLSVDTVNLIESAFTYPFGAVVSVRVYSHPSCNPLIECGFPSEVHVSITLPPLSVTVITAPLISSVPVIVVLLAVTFLSTNVTVSVLFLPLIFTY